MQTLRLRPLFFACSLDIDVILNMDSRLRGNVAVRKRPSCRLDKQSGMQLSIRYEVPGKRSMHAAAGNTCSPCGTWACEPC